MEERGGVLSGAAPRPVHPDHGRLVRDEDVDLVFCHLCGRGFRSLGAHIRCTASAPPSTVPASACSGAGRSAPAP